MSDDSDDYDVWESVERFRGAGNNLNEGFEHLYYGAKNKVKDLPTVVNAVIMLFLWFGGNWVYNRIKTPVLNGIKSVAEAIPAEFLISPAFGLAQVISIPIWAQALGMLVGVIIAQNRIHTQKLKAIKSELVNMNEDPVTATDGGTREAERPKGAGVGGAIAGGFAGASFGPGGVLAGAFLGYLIGEGIVDEGTDEDPFDDNIDPFLRKEDRK